MAYDIGVQTFTYRNFSVSEMCDELEATDLSTIELWPGQLDSTDDPAVEAARKQLSDTGLSVDGCGQHNFTRENVDVRGSLELTKAFGAEYALVEFEPDDSDTIETALDIAEELDLRLCVHNHGPGAIYDDVSDVVALLEQYPDTSRLGACVDTGHFFRSGVTPAEAIPAIGDRIFAVHVKDFVDEETEVVPGDGNLDIPEMLTLLDEHATVLKSLIIEYEAEPENPTPAVETTIERINDAR